MTFELHVYVGLETTSKVLQCVGLKSGVEVCPKDGMGWVS